MYIVMKRNIIFSLVVFFFCLTANAQIKVRGTIVDDKNEPLIGVNIQEEGTTNGSISDVNGQYSITVAGIDSKLSFSFISYKTIVEKVGNRTVINVTLVEDSELLQEVVVVGFNKFHLFCERKRSEINECKQCYRKSSRKGGWCNNCRSRESRWSAKGFD